MESDPQSFDEALDNLFREQNFRPSNTDSWQAEREKWRSLYERCCASGNRLVATKMLEILVSNMIPMADDCKKKIAKIKDDCKKKIAKMKDDCKKEVRKYTIEGLLVDQHEFPFTKKGGTLSGAHSSSNYNRAMASQSEQFVNRPIDPELLPERTKRRHSIMLCKFYGGRNNTFGNEADVRSYVRSALEDAVTIVQGLIDGNGDGENNLLTIRAEASMFTNRPDLIAVSSERFDGMPLFVVEVKQPWKGKINDRIWGQVHDYGEFMRWQGHNNPFVVLSSFNQTYLVWNANDDSCNRMANEKDKRFSEETLTQIRKSPSSKTTNTQLKRGRGRRLDRKLSHSELAKLEDLVCLLVNGLICSLANFQGPPKVHYRSGLQGHDAYVIKLTQQGYEFCYQSFTVTPWNPRCLKGKNTYYLVELIGVGITSRVFRAISKNILVNVS